MLCTLFVHMLYLIVRNKKYRNRKVKKKFNNLLGMDHTTK